MSEVKRYSGILNEHRAGAMVLFSDYAKLQAEVAQWKAASERDLAKSIELGEQLDQLKSWQESVLAEVGDEPVFIGHGYDTYGTEMAQRADHYKERSEHLAARLVDAESCEVDAKRYRWLRDQSNREKAARFLTNKMDCDAAIDGAMEKQPLPTGGEPPCQD